MNSIKDFLPKYREINTILSNAVKKGKITFLEQRSLTDFYNDNSDVKTFEKMVLDVLIEVEEQKSSFVLTHLRTETENNIKLYEYNKESLDAMDIHQLCKSVTSRYNELIKAQSEVTAEYRIERSKINGSLEAMVYRQHTKEEEERLHREYDQVTKFYKEENIKLDELYDERKKLEKEVAPYCENMFQKIYELSLSFSSVLESYSPANKLENKKESHGSIFFNMDIVSKVYEVCNNIQFESLSELDFYNFLNCESNSPQLHIKKGEKIRICYLIHKFYDCLEKERKSEWRKSILKKLDISEKFYLSKYKEPTVLPQSSENRIFVETIDKIFK